LEMFDALQFEYLKDHGYENEINHAFYPLQPYLFSLPYWASNTI